MSKSVRLVEAAIAAAGLHCEVAELPASTRTAKEAAAAVGCEVKQIAKSIVFRGAETDEAILIVASGTNHIDEQLVAQSVGEPLAKATPDFVRERTGFAIGGVAPCGHAGKVRVYLDRDLLSLGSLWAAAGTPHAVFNIDAADLERLTGAQIIDVQ